MAAENKAVQLDIPTGAVKLLTVDELYDKNKYDLSTMNEQDVFKLLE